MDSIMHRIMAACGTLVLIAALVFSLQPDLALAAQGSLAAGSIDMQALADEEDTEATDEAIAVQDDAGKPMYRLYNVATGEHLYTGDRNERNNLIDHWTGWIFEGLGWTAPSSGPSVYRVYNPFNGEHHYTDSLAEIANLEQHGWKNEGFAWHSAKGVPSAFTVHRQYNPNASFASHNFTLSPEEQDNLVKNHGWIAEGPAWYAIPTPAGFKLDREPFRATISGDTGLDYDLQRILAECGKGQYSDDVVLRNCFNRVKGYNYYEGERYWGGPRYLSDGVTIAKAKAMIANGGGNCYQFASLFSWLARGLGQTTRVCSGYVPSVRGGSAPHGWVEIDAGGRTYTCDPDLAKDIPYRNWYMVPYGQTATTYGFWS